MKRLLLLSLLFPLIVSAQTHEQTLSTLGLPMPPNSVFCNYLNVPGPAKTCTAGTNISISGGTISSSGGGGGSGGVSSVGITTTAPWLTIGNSPITSTGNMSITLTSGLTANQVLATPNGSTGALVLRALVGQDLPAINLATTGNGGVGNVLPIANGGTGQNTATLAINALLPSQSGQSSNFLTTNGSTVSWAAVSGGGASSFGALTGGTNLAAAMLVGTGASLGPTGTGTVSANQVNGAAVAASITVMASNGSSQLVQAPTTGTGNVVLATSPAIGNPTLTSPVVTNELNTSNGALSSPAATWSGAPFTGGTGTNTYPLLYGNDGTSPSTWSTAGTYLGFNAPSAFTGNFLDFHVNGGASVYKLTYQGNLTVNTLTTGVVNGSTVPNTAGTLVGSTGAFTVTHCAEIASTSPLQVEDSGAVCPPGGGGSGTVNSGTGGQVAYYATTGIAVSGAAVGAGLGLNSATIATTQTINAQTGTSYAILATDAAKLLTLSNASAIAVSIPVATTAGFGSGFAMDVENIGAGTATITPTTSTINGASTLTMLTNQGCSITSDGTNYQVSACSALPSAVTYLVDTGTIFTLGTGTGACGTSSTLSGGTTVGSFKCTGTAGASTQVVNLPTAPHGWSCWDSDITSGVAGAVVAPVSPTAVTLKVTVAVTSDTVQFGCLGY